jgi:hypothetical protein
MKSTITRTQQVDDYLKTVLDAELQIALPLIESILRDRLYQTFLAGFHKGISEGRKFEREQGHEKPS